MLKKMGMVVVVAAWIMSGLAVSLKAESPEIIGNGGFEALNNSVQISDYTAEKYGWRLNPAYPLKAIVIEEKKAAHSGNVCLRIEAEEAGKEGALWGSSGSIKEGEVCKAKVWAKGTGSFRILLYIYNSTDSSPFKGCMASDKFEVTDEWKEYTYEFKYGENEKKSGVNSFGFAVHVEEGSIIYLDDISLKKQ